MNTHVIFFILNLLVTSTYADVVEYTFDVREWVVDFKRPTIELKNPAERPSPFKIPEESRKGAVLINGQYPAPPIEVFLNDTVRVTVINNMISEATTIHWHGVHPSSPENAPENLRPWADGAAWVSMAPIQPGHNYTYEFQAYPAGTHYYHSYVLPFTNLTYVSTHHTRHTQSHGWNPVCKGYERSIYR